MMMKINFGNSGYASYMQHRLDRQQHPIGVERAGLPTPKIAFGKHQTQPANLFALQAGGMVYEPGKPLFTTQDYVGKRLNRLA
jgi:hypothetical protein